MTFIFTVYVCLHSSHVYLANLHTIAHLMYIVYWTFSFVLYFALIHHHHLCLCGLNSTGGWTVTFSFVFFLLLLWFTS
jgi:hypothetical protein